MTSSSSVPLREAGGKGRGHSGVSFPRDAQGGREARRPGRGDGARPRGEHPAVLGPRGGGRGARRVPRLPERGGSARPARPEGRRAVRAHPLDLLRGAAPHRGPGAPADGRPRVRRAAGALLGRRARRDLLDAGRLRAAALRPQADLRAGLQPLRAGRVPPGHGKRRGARAGGGAPPGDRGPRLGPRAGRLLGGPRAGLGPARRRAPQREGPQRAEVDEHAPSRHGGLREPAAGVGRPGPARAPARARPSAPRPHPRPRDGPPRPLLRRAVGARLADDLLRPRHRGELAAGGGGGGRRRPARSWSGRRRRRCGWRA